MRPIDRIDAEILEHLQKNARLSNRQLAQKIGLAESTTLTRVRRLLDEGILRGFHADVAPEALGIGIQAMIAIRLAKHHRDQVEAFHDHALGLHRVVACFHMAGEYDFLVHVVARDARDLRHLAMDAFTTRPEVAHLETMLIFEHETDQAWPLLLELDHED